MGSESPNISVVVPFYNVLDYATRCVESLLAQKYDDYELILVDDGSTDGTAELLEGYADNPKVRLLHKENGGLSDARNFGVAQSAGKYISFVDGDDFVSPQYLSTLSSAMGESENRLVSSDLMSIPERNAGSFSFSPIQSSALELSKREVCRLVLQNRVPTTGVAKLAPRGLYLKHPFPLGKRYEEIRTIGHYIELSDSFVHVSGEFYAYVIRQNSIVRSGSADCNQVLEYHEAIEEAVNTIVSICPDLHQDAAFFRAHFLTRSHDLLRTAVEDAGKADELERLIHGEVRESISGALRCKGASKGKRARIALYSISPPIYDALYRLYSRIVKGV